MRLTAVVHMATILTLGIILHQCERTLTTPVTPGTPASCPMNCRCFTVSTSRVSASRLLQQYAEMYGWVDGQAAVGCWGRRLVPVELLPNIRYLLLIGDDSRSGTFDYDVPMPKYDVIMPDYGEETTDLTMEEGSQLDEPRIKTIPPGTFERALDLRQLDLRGNKLYELKSGSFDGLQNLQILSLQDNRLRQLPVEALQYLSSLQSLSLSGNHIRMLPEDGFHSLPGLVRLDLGSNLLELLSPRAFDSLGSLQFLNLSNNRLHELPSVLLRDLVELRELNLDGNAIVEYPSDFFLEKSLLLEIVSLNNNRLQSLPVYAFNYQTSLKELHLSNNKLVLLGDAVFSISPVLQLIDISHNSIETLSKETFKNCTNLRTLDASFNKLSKITSDTFGKVPSMTELVMANNNITRISPASIEGLTHLQTLDLTNNALTILQPYTFYGLEDLTSLRLDNNRISVIVPNAFRVSSFSLSSKLTWLYLRGNQLKTLKIQTFRGANYLKMLNLDNNKIASIEMNAFNGLYELVTLSLRDNRLREIKRLTFSGLVNLETLDLGQNSLHRIDLHGLRSILELKMADNELDETASDRLGSLTSLNLLDLSGNRFAWFPSQLVTSLTRLRHLVLAGNILDTIRLQIDEEGATLDHLDISNNNLHTIEGSSLHLILNPNCVVDLSANPWMCDCGMLLGIREMTSLPVIFTNEIDTTCESGRDSNIETELLTVLKTTSALCGLKEPNVSRRFQLQQGPSVLHDLPQATCRKPASVSKAKVRWPWYAIVWYSPTKSMLCNAALIGNDWAITSLRCLAQIRSHLSSTMPDIFTDLVRREQDSLVMAPPGLVIRLGRNTQVNQSEPEEQVFSIMNIHIHANDRGIGLNRPVLLQFVSLATITKRVTPVCTAVSPLTAKRAIVLGWGIKTKKGSPREILQSSRLRFAPCEDPHSDDNVTLFCGVRDRGKPVNFTIDGNMGGALVMKRGRGDWVLLGVGTNEIEERRHVFIDVGRYVKWIASKTELGQQDNNEDNN